MINIENLLKNKEPLKLLPKAEEPAVLKTVCFEVKNKEPIGFIKKSQ